MSILFVSMALLVLAAAVAACETALATPTLAVATENADPSPASTATTVLQLGTVALVATVQGRATATFTASASAPTVLLPVSTVRAAIPTSTMTSGLTATPTPTLEADDGPCQTVLCCPDCELVVVVSVIDGDTIETSLGPVRVYGTNSPEYCARCYAEATERMKELAGARVRLVEGARPQDDNGRLLAYLFTEDGESIDEIMIAEGLAVAWSENGQFLEQLLAIEDKARSDESGCLWEIGPSGGFAQASPSPSDSGKLPLNQLKVERVWSWLRVNDPLLLTSVPGWPGCVAVVSQDGLVFVTSDGPDAPDGFARTLLNIEARVSRSGNEEGLLGLAFHPEFASNGRLYVYYSAASPRRSVISEFVADPLGRVDWDAEWPILEVAQPFANHNGGMLAFGPDGYLYIGLGDGGAGGDPQGHGQDTNTLLGSILRIDVDRQELGREYAVPSDNPFAKGGGAPEIWAYGLRNPWRFSFDRGTGDLWVGDVGQNEYEEVDVIVRGGNYGWNIMEADHCFRPAAGCDTTGLIMPVASYERNDGCSITGGYVYRGTRLPSLVGAYLYGDYCTGKIWALRLNDGAVTEHVEVAKTNLDVTSFGEDVAGELYVIDRNGGIYRIVER